MRTGRFPIGKRPVLYIWHAIGKSLKKWMNLEVPMKKRLQRCCILSSCVLMLMSLCLTAAVCSAAHAEEVGYSTPCIAEGSGGNVSSFPFTEGEKTLLCRFVSEECRDQPYACRVAAAAVVLNRIKQAGFPNTGCVNYFC